MLLGNLSPELHIRLNAQEFLQPNAPWLSWRGLKHVATKLWVEDGQSFGGFATVSSQIMNAKMLGRIDSLL